MRKLQPPRAISVINLGVISTINTLIAAMDYIMTTLLKKQLVAAQLTWASHILRVSTS